MDTSLVVDAVVDLIAAEYTPLGIKVGDGEAPNLSELSVESLATPHIVIYEIPIGEEFESEGYGGGQGMEWVMIQFTVVGVTAMQVRRLAAAAVATAVDRNPSDSSSWIHPIPAVGHKVIDRKRAGKIPTEPSGLAHHGGARARFLVQSTA